MIKEVIFDIDGTLYDYNKGHAAGQACMLKYAKEELGIGEDEFLSSYEAHYKKVVARLGINDAAIHSRGIRLQEMLEDWGKPIFPHVKKLYYLYWDELLRVSSPEPGSLEAIRELKNRGVSIGIGTDMTLRMQIEKLERLGFAPYVDHLVTSQEAGCEKPNADFMRLCVEKARCDASETAFVGDSLRKDAAGAAACGMLGIWYNREGKPLREDLIPANGRLKVIRNFDELVPLIEAG